MMHAMLRYVKSMKIFLLFKNLQTLQLGIKDKYTVNDSRNHLKNMDQHQELCKSVVPFCSSKPTGK